MDEIYTFVYQISFLFHGIKSSVRVKYYSTLEAADEPVGCSA